MARAGVWAVLLCCALAAPAYADRAALDALVRAYPDQLAGHDGTDLIWRDGTRMALSDGEPAGSDEALLRNGLNLTR